MAQPISLSEVFSVVASVVSIILGGFAIWLSVVFYRFSNESSRQIKEASDKIGASVERLEALFSSLYSDTFTMMRDTVSDMRKHIWHADATPESPMSEEAEVRADELIAQVQQQFQQEVGRLLSQQSSTDAQVAQLRGEMKTLVSRAIVESRRAEVQAREVTVRSRIRVAMLQAHKRSRDVTLPMLVRTLHHSLTEEQIVDELFKMAQDGLVTWPGAPSQLSSTDTISLIIPGRGSGRDDSAE